MKIDLKHRLRVGAAAAVCAVLFTGAIFEETLQCEEAIAHLQSCCPDLYSTHACGDGCGTVMLEGGESQCILERDCDELEKANVCERVEALSETDLDDDHLRSWVCP
jgi:hypothetical protein